MRKLRTIATALFGTAGIALAGTLTPLPVSNADSIQLAQAPQGGAVVTEPSAGTGPGPAGADGLTPEHRRQIFGYLEGSPQPMPSGFSVSVGATLPADIVVQPVPQTVIAAAPQFSRYHYAMVGERVVFVEPSGRRVVHVLER